MRDGATRGRTREIPDAIGGAARAGGALLVAATWLALITPVVGAVGAPRAAWSEPLASTADRAPALAGDPPPPGREAQAETPRWEVDTEASELVAVLHKAGLLRFLGHEHGILARGWSADVHYDADDLSSSSIVVIVPVESLEIDSAEARAAAEVDPEGPEGEDLEEIRQTMVGPDQLDAASHPEIRLESTSIEADGDDGLRIHADLTIHGQTREVEVEATRERRGDGVRIRGEFRFEHREFGLEPVSIGGVVKVANEIDLRFDVLARPASAGAAVHEPDGGGG